MNHTSNKQTASTQLSVAIAGGGLVGKLVALALLKQSPDLRITVFEQDKSNEMSAAGFTAAGMLAPFAELETAEACLLDLGLRSIQLWPSLLADLSIEDAFQQQGSLILAHPNDQTELDQFIQQLTRKTTIHNAIETLNAQKIAALEPDLAHHTQGYHLKPEGQVNAQVFMTQAQQYLSDHPRLTWLAQNKVLAVEPNRVITQNNPHHFDWVFDCRGLGAKSETQPLRGVRGEVIWLESPDITLNRPVRLLHPRYKIYLVPRANHQYIVGATEIESEDKSPISVRSNLELLSAVYSVHPSLGEARILNQRTNCRPAYPNNLPKVETQAGKTLINGLYRHGYLLAPALVEQAIQQFSKEFHL